MCRLPTVLAIIAAVSPTPDQSTRLIAEEPLDAAAVTEIVREAGERAIDDDKVVGLSIGVSRGPETLCVRGFGLANVGTRRTGHGRDGVSHRVDFQAVHRRGDSAAR